MEQPSTVPLVCRRQPGRHHTQRVSSVSAKRLARPASSGAPRRAATAANSPVGPCQRQSSTTPTGTSSATVATYLDSANFIDLLRTKYVIGQAGVTFMPGVVGNLSIPKMSAGATDFIVSSRIVSQARERYS